MSGELWQHACGAGEDRREVETLMALSAQEIPEILVDLGIAGAGDKIEVEPLAGGISSAVSRVVVGDRAVVIKQALPQLRVETIWLSDPGRSSVEAKAARYLSSLRPNEVPAILATDASRNLIVMEAVEPGSVNWKAEMLAGRFDLSVATSAGALLGTIHERSSGDVEAAPDFADKEHFRELRLDPYLLEVSRRHTSLRPICEMWVERLDGASQCFVHGDFSPKNILITPSRQLKLLDHEAAHWGDPAFDLAFFMTHLIAKSMRFDDARRALNSFLDAYQATAPGAWALVSGAGQLLGLMMLARVDGKSPLEYLNEDEQRRLRCAGLRLVQTPPKSIAHVPTV